MHEHHKAIEKMGQGCGRTGGTQFRYCPLRGLQNKIDIFWTRNGVLLG